MEKEEKAMWIGIVILILMVILFAVAVFFLVTLKKQGVECMANPLKYTQKLNPTSLLYLY